MKIKKLFLGIIKVILIIILVFWEIICISSIATALTYKDTWEIVFLLIFALMPLGIVYGINKCVHSTHCDIETYDKDGKLIDSYDVCPQEAEAKLMKCPACGKNVSNQAVACPNCGQPTVNSSVKDIDNNYIDNKKNEIACGKPMSKPIIGSFKHINGLNLPENAQCTVLSYPALYEFQSGSLKFTLLKSKVVDVTIKTDREIQQQYVSSIGGAVGGAVLFGPLGAIIGGRAKKKAIKTYYSYLIIKYKDNENLKYIGFDVTNAPFKAQKFVNELKKTNNTITNVDL